MIDFSGIGTEKLELLAPSPPHEGWVGNSAEG